MRTFRVRAVLFAAAAVLAACAEAPPPEPVAPVSPPPPAPPEPPPPAAEPAPAPAAEAPPPKEEPPPPPEKPLREKIVGKWGFDLMASDPGKKAEEDAKKKAGKDEKKLAELMKKVQEAADKEWIEFTADSVYVSYVGDKAVYKAKYEVVKEEGNQLHVKQVGKDEIGKKEMKEEIVVTLVDDSTLQMKDPKKGSLTFKRK